MYCFPKKKKKSIMYLKLSLEKKILITSYLYFFKGKIYNFVYKLNHNKTHINNYYSYKI